MPLWVRVPLHPQIFIFFIKVRLLKLYNSGMKQINIAKRYNASKGTISDIIKKNNKLN